MVGLVAVLGGLLAFSIPAQSASPHSSTVRSASTQVTSVVLDGARRGSRYWGVGAISGGGGNSRLLIDYPEPERSRILDYLFRPNYGASLQMLKLEIGGDSNSSVGAEPSIEPTRGRIDCNSGYEWWLAEEAVKRNPDIKLYGLQWGAPGWVKDTPDGASRPTRESEAATSAGKADESATLFTQADIDYVISWLGCARSHGLKIHYLGGWNERFHPTTDSAGVRWFEQMRVALDTRGYRNVKLVAADRIGRDKWSVARVMASDPRFGAAVDIIGVHDNCGFPHGSTADTVPFGYTCNGSATARSLHKPMWASEDGRMDATLGAATMMRQLINSHNQTGVTGVLEYPLITAMVDNLPMENRGLVTARWPDAGRFTVNRIAWAIAHLTQFVPEGWFYVNGASRDLGNSGSLSSFESPDRRNWSLVAQNTGSYAGQRVPAQRLRLTIKAGLRHRTVHVWGTDLWSRNPEEWFRRFPDVHPNSRTFTYRIPAGYAVSFTSRGVVVGLGPRTPSTPPSPATAPAAYTAVPDATKMPTGLSPIDGQFMYEPCRGYRAGSCIGQLVGQPPVFWLRPTLPPRVPYAVVGQDRWTDYTVSSDVLFSEAGATVGLITRFTGYGLLENADDSHRFDGYEFTLGEGGTWALYRNSIANGRVRLATDDVSAPGIDTWHRLSLTATGSVLVASMDGQRLATVDDATWSHGLAGIESDWSPVQYDDLAVR